MRGYLSFLLLLSSLTIMGQSRKLSTLINKNAVNITAPAIAADGSRIVFLSDYTSTGDMTLMMSDFAGGWNEPVQLPTTFNSPKLNFAYGHYLNFDGTRLYFTSRRSGSRNYDIWSVNYKNGNWDRPVSLGTTINSTSNDGAPSLTPDEREMYFCRCTSMLNYNASGCNIFYSQWTNGTWSEPEELPAVINEGNVMAPRIMADGVTLIYASNKPGGKGKFDLYMSKKDDQGNWSTPLSLDYVNTPEDDLFSSSRLYGNLLLLGKKEGKFDKIYETLIPDQYKPEKVLYLDYNLVRDNFQRPAIFVLQNWDTGELIKTMSIDSGQHSLIMKEGARYHVFIQPVNLRRAPVSRIYDATELVRSSVKKDQFELTSVKTGRNIELMGVQMQAKEPYFPEKSDRLLDHVIRMTKSLDQTIEFQLVQTNYMEDTIFVHEDLTEIRIDTTYTEQVDTIWAEPDTLVMTLLNDSTMTPEDFVDTTRLEASQDSVHLVLSIDSAGVMAEIYPVDSIAEKAPFELLITRNMEITRVYHNDRFEKEAAELRSRMTMMTVPEDKIRIVNIKEEPKEGKPERYIRLIIK